jgi:hypothetical protein
MQIIDNRGSLKMTTHKDDKPVWFRGTVPNMHGIRYGDVVIEFTLLQYIRMRYTPLSRNRSL